ncbi:MAG: AAA family ATPase [Dehalococcoidia bacterium]
MLESFRVQGFGPFEDLDIKHFGHVNLILGKNGAGKTAHCWKRFGCTGAWTRWVHPRSSAFSG